MYPPPNFGHIPIPLKFTFIENAFWEYSLNAKTAKFTFPENEMPHFAHSTELTFLENGLVTFIENGNWLWSNQVPKGSQVHFREREREREREI